MWCLKRDLVIKIYVKKWYVCLGSNHIDKYWQFICRNDAKIWLFLKKKKTNQDKRISFDTTMSIFFLDVVFRSIFSLRISWYGKMWEYFDACSKMTSRGFFYGKFESKKELENKWELTQVHSRAPDSFFHLHFYVACIVYSFHHMLFCPLCLCL